MDNTVLRISQLEKLDVLLLHQASIFNCIISPTLIAVGHLSLHSAFPAWNNVTFVTASRPNLN